MSTEPIKTEFDDSIRELNYNDAKERFPKIVAFYKLIHEYQDAPNLFVPTDGSQVYPTTRYKQNDVPTDWYGSWRHIIAAFSPGIRQTMEELLAYYDKQVKDGTITQSAADFKPERNGSMYYNSENFYLNYFNNAAFPYRGWGNFTNLTRDALLKLEPILSLSMKKFVEANGDNFEKITQARINKDLLAKPISSLTGNEFFGLLERFLEDHKLKVVPNDQA